MLWVLVLLYGYGGKRGGRERERDGYRREQAMVMTVFILLLGWVILRGGITN